jgi:hypothetical protein
LNLLVDTFESLIKPGALSMDSAAVYSIRVAGALEAVSGYDSPHTGAVGIYEKETFH